MTTITTYRRIPFANPGLIHVHAHFDVLISLSTGWTFTLAGLYTDNKTGELAKKVCSNFNLAMKCSEEWSKTGSAFFDFFFFRDLLKRFLLPFSSSSLISSDRSLRYLYPCLSMGLCTGRLILQGRKKNWLACPCPGWDNRRLS